MNAKELLIPRFEVVEDYPNSTIKKGSIITPINEKNLHYDCIQDHLCNLIFKPERYPHLFRKLNWWEKRTKEQMPKKLISLSKKDAEGFLLENQEIHNILDWDMNGLHGYTNIEKREVCCLVSWNPEYSYIPVD